MPRYIDADALLDSIRERYCTDCDKRKGIKSGKYRIIYKIGEAPCRACGIDDMKGEIEDAPSSADVRENVKGKWIEVDAILQKEKDLIKGNKRYTCSVCGASDTHAIHKEVPYCWFCGADMRGEQDE